MNSEITPKVEQTSLEASAERARQAWRRLGLRLRSITPSGLMRFLLVLGALAVIGWVVSVTWVWLVPFLVGAMIGYAVLPLVNQLNRFMPRFLAVLLPLILALAGILFFFALLVPTLVEQFYRFYLNLPGIEEIKGYVAQLNQYLASLPAPVRERLQEIYTQYSQNSEANRAVYLTKLTDLTIATLLSAVNIISFGLGFLTVPPWLFSVLQDQARAVQALNRQLPAWLRPDLWAILRIFGRTFNAFVRGQMLLALATSGLTYLGLAVIVALFGLPGNVRYELLLAMTAGLTQLIPTIGPFLGTIPAVLIALTISYPVTQAVIVLYVSVQLILSSFIAPRVERSIIDIHPAILLVVVVVLSSFGFWWVLLAAPVTAIARDLFQYTYGRFSDPSRPAGLLPGEPLPQPAVRPAPAPGRRIPPDPAENDNLGDNRNEA